jgi:protein O-GlcNAc transferase
VNSIPNPQTKAANVHLTSVLQRGLAYHQRGDLEQAEQHYRLILDESPMHADALHLLGVLLNQKQDCQAAIDLIRRAVQLIPQQPVFYSNLGNALRDCGRCSEAIDCYQKALRIKSDLVETHINLGIAYHQLTDFDQAVSAFQKAITLKPDSAEAYYNLAHTFKEQQLFDDAISCYQKVITINPMFAEAHYNLAIILEQQQHLDAAIDCLNLCLRIRPQWAEAYNNLGNCFKHKGLNDRALAGYQKAVELKPGLYTAYNNLGNMRKDQGCYAEAIACYQRALHFHPEYAEAHLNYGITLAEADCPAEAVDQFQEAIRINPHFAQAHAYMGLTLADIGKRSAAIDCFKKAIEINPAYTEAYGYLIYQLQYVCDWQQSDSYSQMLNQAVSQTGLSDSDTAEPPFIRMTRQSDLAQQLTNARAWCRRSVQSLQNLKLPFAFESRRTNSGKLMIGYLSGDFYDHATAHLMRSVFGLHDRQKFQVYCYSYGPDDGSSYRQQIRRQSDHFIDIRQMSQLDAARRIYADRVDILVDLKGHTKGARLGIPACRPSPIQVHFLGYPGTTGADFIDYLITDKIVTPPEHASFYSEKLAILPYSYQVNDHQQAIAPRIWTKKEQGLPEKGFVFSSFNLPYKIDPLLFNRWMCILHQVPGSVLWLYKAAATAATNLAREAKGRGIDPQRLIFAEKLPKADHLARLQLADLALDTRIVNGHTTTSDSLWAGVPVLTLQGEPFAARVSASLLNAIGLPELIVKDLDAYERLAVRLATQPAKLQKLRIRLSQNRLTAPLFDTPAFVRHLESAYQKMWRLFRQGQSPQQFEVVAA